MTGELNGVLSATLIVEKPHCLMHIPEQNLKWPIGRALRLKKKEGAMRFHNHIYKLVDLPGIYSLTSYSMEELYQDSTYWIMKWM